MRGPQDADLGHIHAWTMREVEAAQIAAGLERAGLGYPSEQQVAAAAAAPPSREELAALHSSARQVTAAQAPCLPGKLTVLAEGIVTNLFNNVTKLVSWP